MKIDNIIVLHKDEEKEDIKTILNKIKNKQERR